MGTKRETVREGKQIETIIEHTTLYTNCRRGSGINDHMRTSDIRVWCSCGRDGVAGGCDGLIVQLT